MKSKKTLVLLTTIVLLVVCTMFLGACEMKYNDLDKLGVGDMNVGERIVLGLQVTLLGVGTVFIVLIILIGLIMLMRTALTALTNVGKKKKNEQVKATPIVTTPTITLDEDEEIVAVITAAITAYYDTVNTVEKSDLKFKVRKINRIY